MYVHIGGDLSISEHFIIGIFDLDAVTHEPVSNETMGYLRRMEANGRLETLAGGVPRSLVASLDRAYLSPVSALTLQARLNERGYKETDEQE